MEKCDKIQFQVGDEVVYLADGEVGVVVSLEYPTKNSYHPMRVEYPSGTHSSHALDGTFLGNQSIRKLSKLEKALR